MPLVTNNYPDCYDCCACANGYLTTIFGNTVVNGHNQFLCDDAVIRSAPVHFLAEFTFDKATGTFPSQACKDAIPDSVKAKFTSGWGVYPPFGNILNCATSMKICTGTTYGSHPSAPHFRFVDGFFLNHGWGGGGPYWLGQELKSFNSETFAVTCDGGETKISTFQPGATRITSSQCSPFEMKFNYSTDGTRGYQFNFSATYTLATDCSDPYSPTVNPPVGPSPPPPTPAEIQRVTIPCIHLGPDIEDPATCGCGTAVLKQCAVHGQCRRTGYPKAGEQICLTCPDYQSP